MSTNAKTGDTQYPLLDKYSTLPIASLSHTTVNIGDEIQTLAADQFAEHIETRFDREELAVCTPDKDFSMILNGWYPVCRCIGRQKRLISTSMV